MNYVPDKQRVNVFLFNSIEKYKITPMEDRKELIAIVNEGIERYASVLKDIPAEAYQDGISGFSYQEMAVKLEAGKQFIKKVKLFK